MEDLEWRLLLARTGNGAHLIFHWLGFSHMTTPNYSGDHTINKPYIPKKRNRLTVSNW